MQKNMLLEAVVTLINPTKMQTTTAAAHYTRKRVAAVKAQAAKQAARTASCKRRKYTLMLCKGDICCLCLQAHRNIYIYINIQKEIMGHTGHIYWSKE